MKSVTRHSLFSILYLLSSILSLCVGCDRPKSSSKQVVIYTSVDQPIAQPILDDFQKQTGIRVIVQTDAEATKTVGLAERLRAEKDNPQADVWWGNEPFHTINLAEEGVLAPYESPAAKDIPEMFKDPRHRWAGSAIRVRCIAAWSKAHQVPKGLLEFTQPQFKDHITLARPSAGTTGGHVAAIYGLWGDEKADQFFRDLRHNGVKILGGNSVVAEQVARGTLWAGLTDNDDVHAARQHGSVNLILPDQQSIGTLVIPCTVGMAAGAKNSDEAKKLIDYLLSREVEQKLIDAKFAYASVRETASGGGKVRAMQIDYAQVAKIMPQAVRRATAILEGRE